MHNMKLTVAYDGTDFRGWQIQPGQPTIQGLLTDVVRQLTQESVTLQGAGRTDAGVHAWGQVVSFKTQSGLAPQELQRGCNALLPPSIRVRDAEEVGPLFHARWDAQAKTYTYSIYRGSVVPPFRWRYVLHVPQELDFERMAQAARCFEGVRDFTSFSASTGSEEDDRDRMMVRSIFRSELIDLSANAPPDLSYLPWGSSAMLRGVGLSCSRQIFFALYGQEDYRHDSARRPRTDCRQRHSEFAGEARPPLFRAHCAASRPLPAIRRISRPYRFARERITQSASQASGQISH